MNGLKIDFIIYIYIIIKVPIFSFPYTSKTIEAGYLDSILSLSFDTIQPELLYMQFLVPDICNHK